MNSTEIKNMINDIKNIISNLDRKGITNKEEYFWNNHPDIMNKYPFLVSLLVTDNNPTMLDKMVKQLELIEKGKITKEQADTSIGKQLGDTYLEPFIEPK